MKRCFGGPAPLRLQLARGSHKHQFWEFRASLNELLRCVPTINIVIASFPKHELTPLLLVSASMLRVEKVALLRHKWPMRGFHRWFHCDLAVNSKNNMRRVVIKKLHHLLQQNPFAAMDGIRWLPSFFVYDQGCDRRRRRESLRWWRCESACCVACESSATVIITKHMPAKVKRVAAKVPPKRCVRRGLYVPYFRHRSLAPLRPSNTNPDSRVSGS